MLKVLVRTFLPYRLRWLISVARASNRLSRDELQLFQQQLLFRVGKINTGTHVQPSFYAEDGLITEHNCDFLNDPRFKGAYDLGNATGSWEGWSLRWRAYVVCWCAEWASRLEGDFVECGVYKGGFARMILEYIDLERAGKRLFLFDTFCGFSDVHLLSEEAKIKEHYSYPECLKEVRDTFAGYGFVTIIPGTVPETLARHSIERVAFLSIDMNCVGPEIAAAEHFWPKMPRGGVMVLDDYGHSLHIAQKNAFDSFAERHGVSVLCLPTGQGLILKP